MKLTPEQQTIFDSIPADAARSRLDAHLALILRWHAQHRTYRRIRELLAEHFSIQVSISMLHKFVSKYAARTLAEPEPKVGTVVPVQRPIEEAEPVGPRRTPEEIAAARESARLARKRPVKKTETDTQSPPPFHYDPTQKLINKNYLD